MVEEYINHITPFWFKLLADPTTSYKSIWNRENWIPVEFNLLYRWHSLVPEITNWRGADFPMADARFGNAPMISRRARRGARCGEHVRRLASRPIQYGRNAANGGNGKHQTRPRQSISQLQRLSRGDEISALDAGFEQISGDPDVVGALRDLYGNVDQVEFFVGLFAEDAHERSAVPRLMGRMVAADAFSHALTNPLLAPKIFHEDTFTPIGWASIGATSTLADIADRNLPNGAGAWRICMDHPEHHSVA